MPRGHEAAAARRRASTASSVVLGVRSVDRGHREPSARVRPVARPAAGSRRSSRRDGDDRAGSDLKLRRRRPVGPGHRPRRGGKAGQAQRDDQHARLAQHRWAGGRSDAAPGTGRPWLSRRSAGSRAGRRTGSAEPPAPRCRARSARVRRTASGSVWPLSAPVVPSATRATIASTISTTSAIRLADARLVACAPRCLAPGRPRAAVAPSRGRARRRSPPASAPGPRTSIRRTRSPPRARTAAPAPPPSPPRPRPPPEPLRSGTTARLGRGDPHHAVAGKPRSRATRASERRASLLRTSRLPSTHTASRTS